jgi:RNA polymerase subunit RPABC4/transcription elongation factor Spt4
MRGPRQAPALFASRYWLRLRSSVSIFGLWLPGTTLWPVPMRSATQNQICLTTFGNCVRVAMVSVFSVDEGEGVMALKPCKSCKHPIHHAAERCPSCGADRPGVSFNDFSVVFLGIVILIVASVILKTCTSANG